MSANDIWVYRKGDKLYRRVENDGWTFMNRGPEAHDDEIIGICGHYWVILAGGARATIRYTGDWEKVVAHFTEPRPNKTFNSKGAEQ